jgi:hypothetical protein
MEHDQAVDILRETELFRRRTRSARRSIWFPLVVLGALAMGSAALCSEDPIGGTASSVYWVVAGALAYPTVYLFYRRRSLKQGLSDGVAAFVAVGLGLVALTLNLVVGGHRTGNSGYARIIAPSGYLSSWPVAGAVALGAAIEALLAWRMGRRGLAILVASVGVVALLFAARLILPEALFLGANLLPNTLPIVVAAVALLVLAWIERSPGLATIAISLGVLGILSGLFIIDNRFHATLGCGVDLLAIGGFAMACGLGAAIVEWRRP